VPLSTPTPAASPATPSRSSHHVLAARGTAVEACGVGAASLAPHSAAARRLPAGCAPTLDQGLLAMRTRRFESVVESTVALAVVRTLAPAGNLT
jgi:hypothetical protein